MSEATGPCPIEFAAMKRNSQVLTYRHSNAKRLGHSPFILELIQEVKDPDAMERVLKKSRVPIPAIFTPGTNNEGILRALTENGRFKGEYRGTFHGTNGRNAQEMIQNGVSFAPGEGDILSGFYTTQHLNNAEGWAGHTLRRTDAFLRQKFNADSPEEFYKKRIALYEDDPEIFNRTVLSIHLSPGTKIIDLTGPKKSFEMCTGGDNRAYQWFSKLLASGKAPTKLEPVLSREFLTKYFDTNGKLKREANELWSRQGFAHLFGADALLTDALYGMTRQIELVLIQKKAAEKITIQASYPEEAARNFETWKKALERIELVKSLGLKPGSRIVSPDWHFPDRHEYSIEAFDFESGRASLKQSNGAATRGADIDVLRNYRIFKPK